MDMLVSWLKNKFPSRVPLRALIWAVALFVVGAAAVFAKATLLPSPTPQEPATTNSNKDKPDFGTHEDEMRAKLIIKEEKKRYDEHLERAREVSHLASQLVLSYEATRAFNSEDNKKLERLEKLTKRIRNEAGGSDTNPDAKDLPADKASALKRVAQLAQDLRKLVEKTPRHVISAAVIEQANRMIAIIQFVRNPERHGAS